MGIYVNPGNMTFRKALNSEIYVDKTELITAVNRRFEHVGLLSVRQPSAAFWQIHGCGHADSLLQQGI